MLAGLDFLNFAAPIRQILAGIAAHAIGAPIARVLTQPGPEADLLPQFSEAIPVGRVVFGKATAYRSTLHKTAA